MSKLTDAFQLATWDLAVDDRPLALKAMTAEAPTTERYNFFLYRLARIFRPVLYVETGTDRGRSALHVACGLDGLITTRVISIDIEYVCSDELRGHALQLGLRNVEARTGDSVLEAENFAPESIDLLFLDSLHTYDHLKRELKVYLPKMQPGGLIVLDDIHINPDMRRCWDEIPLDKRDVSSLHFSGFGLVGVP